ncbi:exo-alpha-sialidase [Rubinisphaera sp. JC750]|uniref:exo-alpha-sialidase n=1 Tax=Rubinisphaera sp. JC750 TaxID=2898658 RepID=UPI001F314352|nr:exo-alpha-sialidase [Rubinisphaera sp. JC750]
MFLRYAFASVLLGLCCCAPLRAESPDSQVVTLGFDGLQNADNLEPHGGNPVQVDGPYGKAVGFDGNTLLEWNVATQPLDSTQPFTVSLWFTPYRLDRGQQMLIGKNRYSQNEREWGVMIDDDGKLRLYVRQGGWKTIESDTELQSGRWYQLNVVRRNDSIELWLNGERAASLKLSQPLASTSAPVTLGGILDDGRLRQTFVGAMDEVKFYNTALSAADLKTEYTPVERLQEIPQFARPFTLWDENAPLGTADELEELQDVEFHVIKKWDRPADGYTFLHGVALCWHKGRLFASIGHNKGAENTVTEEAQYRVSDDGGRTWSELRVIDAGEEPNLAVSHGVFHSHNGHLWAFHGAYSGKMENIHTRAYRLDESTGNWEKLETVIENGFWPMNQPQPLANGNWIMPGIAAGPYSNGKVFPAAVAISHGDDFTQWDYVEIPAAEHVRRMWGESALFVAGQDVINIARYGGEATALAAVSKDQGRTWTASHNSNLPMATSKPAAGTLSTGQHYLVCTTARNNGGKRTPLTIAVTKPDETTFSKVFVIRRSLHADQPGESAERLSLSYPCATEHDGRLYVGFSNNGGRRANLNSAEMAIIPVEQLSVE